MQRPGIANPLERLRAIPKTVNRNLIHHLLLISVRSVWREDMHIEITGACRDCKSRHEGASGIAREAGIVVCNDEHAHVGKVTEPAHTRCRASPIITLEDPERGWCELGSALGGRFGTTVPSLHEQKNDRGKDLHDREP